MIQGAGALRGRGLKITRISDRTVAILVVLYHEGLVALRKGFILQPGSEMSLPPKQCGGQNTRKERIGRRKKMEKECESK